LVVFALAFAPALLLDNAVAGGVLGLALAAVLVALARPSGLVSSWRYLRALA
jgi:hypothetical protein